MFVTGTNGVIRVCETYFSSKKQQIYIWTFVWELTHLKIARASSRVQTADARSRTVSVVVMFFSSDSKNAYYRAPRFSRTTQHQRRWNKVITRLSEAIASNKKCFFKNNYIWHWVCYTLRLSASCLHRPLVASPCLQAKAWQKVFRHIWKLFLPKSANNSD